MTTARFRIELASVTRHGATRTVPAITVTGTGGSGAVYVARILGLHPVYGFRRQFLGERIHGTHRKRWTRVTVPLEELRDGDILEIQSGETRTVRYRDFFAVRDGALVPMHESAVRRRFQAGATRTAPPSGTPAEQ